MTEPTYEFNANVGLVPVDVSGKWSLDGWQNLSARRDSSGVAVADVDGDRRLDVGGGDAAMFSPPRDGSRQPGERREMLAEWRCGM